MATPKTSAELEREVSEQRTRVEERLGEIRDRLSPGQLLDEALAYTRSGGAHFASNLAQQVTANPMPAALVGVGLAWLIASSGRQASTAVPEQAWGGSGDDYPYARASSGGIKRVSHAADESGQWWSEFQTDEGDTFRAQANETGHRAGHFIDDTGKRFSGFIDETGNHVQQFQDEAGNRLEDALGWASHSWSSTQAGLGNAVNAAAAGAGQLGNRLAQGTGDLAGTLQAQSNQLGRQMVDLFNKQPLVAGALAFAAGAAVGALLPSTEQEDALMGEQADKIRDQATKTAGELYEKGKEQVGQVYETATNTGAKLYETAKDQINHGNGTMQH